MENVKFKVGTSEEYNALPYKDPFTLYFLLDTNQIYKGSVIMGAGKIESLEQDSTMILEFYKDSRRKLRMF